MLAFLAVIAIVALVVIGDRYWYVSLPVEGTIVSGGSKDDLYYCQIHDEISGNYYTFEVDGNQIHKMTHGSRVVGVHEYGHFWQRISVKVIN